METITLLLAALFSLTVSTSNPKLPQGNDVTAQQTTTSTTCEENCQLPAQPDDDEDDD